MKATGTTPPSHRRFTAIAAGCVLMISGVIVGAGSPADGAPPDNDTIASASAITGIPTRIVQDTLEASAETGDGKCVHGDSVWYRFRPTTTTTGRVVTIGSDFDTVLAVFSGRRADRTRVACSDDAAGLASAAEIEFVAGTSYWIAVSACCGDGGVGGRSVLTLYQPRPAAATATLDSVETGTVSGRIFASGTARCATPSVATVRVTVSQRVGQLVARGSGSFEAPLCGPRSRAWAVQVDSRTGVAFQEGMASVTVRVDSSDGFVVAETEHTETVPVGSDPDRAAHG